MNSIQRIANSDYYAISVGQQDDWIMRLSMGRTTVDFRDSTCRYSLALRFYDATRRELAGRLRTPPASSSDGKDSDSTAPVADFLEVHWRAGDL